VLSLAVDDARTIATIAAVVMIVAAVVISRLITSLVLKAVSLVVLVGLAAALWVQRGALADCAEGIARDPAASCSFFGIDVDVR
jgi:ABC-type transport system involved in cytochrome bd biosynthesis fused ATPase/permease subunit